MLRQRREMDHPAEVERGAWGGGPRTSVQTGQPWELHHLQD